MAEKKIPTENSSKKKPDLEPQGPRFLGTQMDLAILIFGLFMLLALAGWIKQTFFSVAQ